MEKKQNDNVVFYGPLPVNKPCPIIKPNDKIQLQPTVHPVAITPYISLEGEEGQNAAADNEEIVAEEKGAKRVSARVAGVLMMVFVVVCIILFAFSMAKKYPIGAAEQYISLKYFWKMFETMVAEKQFAKFDMVFVPYLITVGVVCGAVNFILALIATITGKRKGYSLFAFITFITFVVAAFYEMHFFSQIKDIGNLLSKDCGWPCLMLIIIGCADLIVAFICGLICPKHKVVETVEF